MRATVIAGAGPAGRAAAAALTHGGAEVILVDARSDPLDLLDEGGIERRRATAFHAEPGLLWLWSEERIEELAWSALVIATGADAAFAPEPGGAGWREVGTLPDNRLAAALGCAYAFDNAACWLLPEVGFGCETSVSGVYVVGGARGVLGETSASEDGAR
jgi:NADPH-dependent 2,4-dienoyl-CoA reductase/sulfur reductase-like enzyme